MACLYGCVDDPWMCGTDGIGTAFSRDGDYGSTSPANWRLRCDRASESQGSIGPILRELLARIQ